VDETEKKANETSDETSTEATVQKDEQQSKPVTPAAVKRPTIGTPVGRPKIGTPIGTSNATPSSLSSTPAPATKMPTISTPLGTAAPKPTVGTPVGDRPSIGTPVGSSPKPAPAVGTTASAVARPVVSTASVARPTTPVKKPVSKEDISRRNFMKGLVVLGGLVAVVQFGALGPFLTGSVGATNVTSQQILDSITGEIVTASTFDDPNHLNWVTFVYPRSNPPDPNLDNDTFRQCVAIKLPKGFTAPADLSTTDSAGNVYVGFSRVCVHLWCLWSYVNADNRMECPCHGSQYVPGSGLYPTLSLANNQPPGLAVQGPASLQVAPNNQLPIINLKINSDGTFSAFGVVGQIGCGQKC